MQKITYKSGDIQFFKKGILVKSILKPGIIIDYSTNPKTINLITK